jgi:protein phosphatase
MDDKPKRRAKPTGATSRGNTAVANNHTAPIETTSAVKIVTTPQLVANRVEIGFLSNVGQVRTNNEDSFSAFTASVPRLNNDGPELVFTFLAIADGMGGHENGEIASNMAVQKISEGVLRDFYLPSIEGRQPGRNGDSPLETLSSLIENANQCILQESQRNRTSMGTTLTCAVLIGQTAIIGHVGDSRLYVLEKSSGKLRQVSHDHSVVQRLVEMGALTAEEAQYSPQRSVLYMTVGQKPQVEPDVEVLSLLDVRAMLLCSDGLWELVEDPVIEETLRKAGSAAEACEKLVNAANEAGGVDNVTVVIARF